VALAGVTAQEFIQRFFAAVERFPIVFLVDPSALAKTDPPVLSRSDPGILT
jgi:hypothetical protein